MLRVSTRLVVIALTAAALTGCGTRSGIDVDTQLFQTEVPHTLSFNNTIAEQNRTALAGSWVLATKGDVLNDPGIWSGRHFGDGTA